MSIGITSNYSSYALDYTSAYAKNATNSSETENVGSAQEETITSSRTTAAEELAYLTQKYNNYSFVSANYTQGMTYGSSTTVNVAISPQFLEKMANDSELEAEYEEQIALMQEIDERLIRTEAAKGYKLQTGWAIDKDGGISKWGIGTKDNKKPYLQTMSENAAKIREKALEKKKEQKKTEEKRLEKKEDEQEQQKKLKEKVENQCREQFGGKFRLFTLINEDDRKQAAGKNAKAISAGVGVDMKI